MKKLSTILLLVLLFSCDTATVPKPDRLIDEDKMVDILYDLSVLDAVRSQKPYMLTKENIDPNTYIYSKYKIDSVQFAQSNKYYASQINLYKKMYGRVGKRLKQQISDLDSVSKIGSANKKPKNEILH